MPDAAALRDSTQIVLPRGTIEGLCEELEAEFTVTVREEETVTRIIGSPVVIKRVSEFLVRHGVTIA